MARKFARRHALYVLSAMIVLIAVTELVLRASLGLGNPPLFQSDPEIGYLMVANQEVYRRGGRIKINAFHQRADDLPERRPDDALRILFVGDSITFGVTGVDQTRIYSELVGSALRGSGQNVEVMNASAVSWGIGNALAYIRRFGTFDSQITILQIGSGDLLQPTSTGDAVGRSASQPDRKPFSAIGELVRRILLPRLAALLGLDAHGDELTPSEQDRLFMENMQYLDELVAEVREHGSLPLVLMMPGLSELVPEEDRQSAAGESYPDRFRGHLKQLAVPFIDVPVLWRGDPDVTSYYTDGTHLTATGNEAVSREIVAALSRLE